jgi:hypothetical protein
MSREQISGIEFTVTDALAPPAPLEWCVEGLFPRSSVSILVGDPGSKKTFTVIELAVCVALGKPWLDHPVAQGPVLFIDEQTGPRQLLARFNAALNAHAASTDTPLHIRSLAGHNLRDKDSADEIINLARSKNAHLIVIDAFSNLLHGSSESSLAAVLPVLFHLRRIAEVSNAAIVVTHHTNRHGSFRGSYAIPAAVDLMLQVESKSDDSVIAFHTIKSRLLAPPSFSANASFETAGDGSARFYLTRQLGRASSPQNLMQIPPGVSGVAFTVFDEIWHHEKMTFKQLYARRRGSGEQPLRNAVQQLLDEGVIVRVDGGAQGAEATYALARPP